MIENLQEKLYQGKRKQSKGEKICASIIWELDCEKCSKTFCEIFARQNIQNQNNTKHFSNPDDIFNPHKHKMGPRGIQALYFWQPFLLKKCQKAQVLCISPF